MRVADAPMGTPKNKTPLGRRRGLVARCDDRTKLVYAVAYRERRRRANARRPASREKSRKPTPTMGPGNCQGSHCDVRNLNLTVAGAAVRKPQEIKSADVSKRGQRYRFETGAEVYVAPKLRKIERPRSVRINEKLDERTGLIALSSHADHILPTGDRLEREGRRLAWIIGIELDLVIAGDKAGAVGQHCRTESQSDLRARPETPLQGRKPR